ncbi:MAG: hypothetical protein Q8R55_05180 [Candidatus Taylorbacteria bacterium]|nr:hypothetical protein [Candidatus Taylorbacteria bacterium]
MENHGLVSDFDQKLKNRVCTETNKFTQKRKIEITMDILHRVLQKHLALFPRYVTQSEKRGIIPPFGYSQDRYYDVMREVGVINNRHLFVENDEYLRLYEEKGNKKTTPPTVVPVEKPSDLVRNILGFLEKMGLSRIVKDNIGVPSGFYVFEFTAKERCWPGGSERKHTKVTVTPFVAKNLKDAISIFLKWPQGSWYKDLSNFRVCTSTGWTKLASVRDKYVEQWYAQLSDYTVSPQ